MTKFAYTGLVALALALGAPGVEAQTNQNPSDFKLQPKEQPRVDPRLQGPEIDAPRDDRPPPQQRVAPPQVVTQQPTSRPTTAQPQAQTQRTTAPVQQPRQVQTRPTPQAGPSQTTQTQPAVTDTNVAVPNETAPVTTTTDAVPVDTAPATNIGDAANDKSGTGGFPWWLAGLGLLAMGLLGGYLWGKGGRRKAKDIVVEKPVVERASDRASAALPERGPPAAPVRPVAQPIAVPAPKPRAWLEIEFEPTEARSTPLSASLGYKLKVRNSGDRDAVGITVDALMTSAGEQQDQILGRFYAQDISQPIAELEEIPAGGEVELNGQFDLGTKDIHPIRMADRVLLVPLVAFSLRYDRGDGRGGQTDQAFVIGRETNPPSDKMGPFRLDLGPRHYKSVGKREHLAVRRA